MWMNRRDVITVVMGLLVMLGVVAGQYVHADPLEVTLEVGASLNLNLHPADRHAWQDGGSPVASFRLKLEKGKVACGYTHVSNWFTGAPFNNRVESTLDTVGCSYKFHLYGG